MAQTAPCTYLETFDQHTGGWWGWGGNHLGLQALPRENSAVTSRSPWWIDYNHAPPGAGYLHMLFSLNLRGPFSDHHKEDCADRVISRFEKRSFLGTFRSGEVPRPTILVGFSNSPLGAR